MIKKNPYIEQLQTNIIEQLKVVSQTGINQNHTLALRTQLRLLHNYVANENTSNEKYATTYNSINRALTEYEQNEKLFDNLEKNYHRNILAYLSKLIDLFSFEISTHNGTG